MFYLNFKINGHFKPDIVTGVLALGAPIAMSESSAMKGSSNLDFKSNYPMSFGALTMSLGVLPMTLRWPHNYIPIQVQKLNRNVALRAPGSLMLRPFRDHSVFDLKRGILILVSGCTPTCPITEECFRTTFRLLVDGFPKSVGECIGF
jgi:hypothetical protein